MTVNKHNILIVDDEEDILMALYDTFSEYYNVFKTTNPKEGLEIVKKEEIALIISDQRMPQMNGSDLLAEIYRIKPETLRVLLTGYADINAAIDAINKGSIHKYVEKPWDNDVFLELVKNLITIYNDSQKKVSILSRVQTIVQNESSLRTIINNVKDCICTMDEEGHISFANSRALNILGCENIEAVKSKKIFNIEQSDLEEFKKEFKKNKKVKSKIFTAIAKDNSLVDVLLTPVFKQDDERMVGVIFQGI